MKKLLLLMCLGGGLASLSFAENFEHFDRIERAVRDVNPTLLVLGGTGGLTLFIGVLLAYLATSYGIYLLAKKYEPSLHPALSWIPVVNIYPLVKISGQPLWWIAVILLAGMVPFIGPIVALGAMIFIYHQISLRTGRAVGTTLLLVFFSVVMLPWLGLTVNKKSTKKAWILGVLALVVTLTGCALLGASAVGGLIGMKKNHRFMDRARQDIMKEIQDNPNMREQLKELENKMGKSDASTGIELNTGTSLAK